MKIICITGYAININGDFVGVKNVGKDTFAHILQNSLCNYECHVLSLADSLKDIVSELYDLPRDEYDTYEQKDVIIPKYNVSYRYILERVGTNLRNELGKYSLWVNKLKSKISELKNKQMEKIITLCKQFDLQGNAYDVENVLQVLDKYDIKPFKELCIIIPDLRFIEEYDAIRPDVVVQVKRIIQQPVNCVVHPSNQLLNIDPDVRVYNNGTIEELIDYVGKVDNLLSTIP